MSSFARWARVGTYPTARLAAVLATAALFFGLAGCIGYLVELVLVDGALLRPLHAQLLAAVMLMGVTFFGGHAAAMGLLDAYSQGRFPLPERGLPPPSAARLTNPWQAALRGALGAGLSSAALAWLLVPRLWPGGAEPVSFALILGSTSALIAAAQTYARTGRLFLQEATLPHAARAFRGSHSAYLWLRHALPQGLANLFLNAWAAAALVPGPFFAPNTAAPLELVLGDAFGNMTILLIATAGGTAVHVSFDLRWGVIPQLPAARSPVWQRNLLLAAGLATLLGVQYLWFIASHSAGLSAWAFVCVRGLCCGLLCGGAAYFMGRWTLHSPSGG